MNMGISALDRQLNTIPNLVLEEQQIVYEICLKQCNIKRSKGSLDNIYILFCKAPNT